jgi:hypothetical protein
MNLSESIGFFGESSSKIINTAILGELKLEIIFTSQIASCILGSAVPADVPVYTQTTATLENQNNVANTTIKNGDIVADATSRSRKLQRRVNIQNYTANFTTGDTGVPTAGNFDISFNSSATKAGVAAETAVYNISNIILHIEVYQFKTREYYDVMKSMIVAGKYKYHFKRYVCIKSNFFSIFAGFFSTIFGGKFGAMGAFCSGNFAWHAPGRSGNFDRSYLTLSRRSSHMCLCPARALKLTC